jgi:hypothetical protein
LNSMRTLDAHFVHNADFYDDDVLPPADRHVLFAGIEACMQISTIFPLSVCGVV